MTLPHAEVVYPLMRLIKQQTDYLDYCMNESVEANDFSYVAKDDEVIYHHTIKPLDEELLPALRGYSEIWIITGSGDES